MKHFDKNRDGRLSLEEADAIESIECSTDNIYSLKGIEFMSNLRNLHAQGPNGKLKNLDLNNNLFLANVALSENELTELIIDKCVSLRTLYVSNNKLKELTIGPCPGLQILSCNHNHISDLDLQKCPNIEHLSINDNLFTDIDISNLNRIQELGCSNNPLISLIIKDLPYLSVLNCQFNSIDTLSLSNLPSLSALYLTASIQKGRYHFSNIPNLTSLDIGNNYLSFFDFSQYHKLFYASCYSNLNEVLDFSSTSNLNALFCGCNENLKTLILKKGTSIEGVTYNRSYDKNNRYIPPQTEIVFVD